MAEEAAAEAVAEAAVSADAVDEPVPAEADAAEAPGEADARRAGRGRRRAGRRHRGRTELLVEDLLEYLARSLVDEPDEVSVESFEEDDGTVVLELRVAEDDAGQVIGRGGRTIAALRTWSRPSAVRHDRRVLVDVVD